MRIHSYRHQFASLLVSSGRSLFDVQVLLGHSDPRVSQRYAKLSVQALKEASSFGSIIVQSPPAVAPTPSPPRPDATPIPKEGRNELPADVGGLVLPFHRAA